MKSPWFLIFDKEPRVFSFLLPIFKGRGKVKKVYGFETIPLKAQDIHESWRVYTATKPSPFLSTVTKGIPGGGKR